MIKNFKRYFIVEFCYYKDKATFPKKQIRFLINTDMSVSKIVGKFKDFINQRKSVKTLEETFSQNEIIEIEEIYRDFCEDIDFKIVETPITQNWYWQDEKACNIEIVKTPQGESKRVVIRILVNRKLHTHEDLKNYLENGFSVGRIRTGQDFKDLLARLESLGYETKWSYMVQNLTVSNNLYDFIHGLVVFIKK